MLLLLSDGAQQRSSMCAARSMPAARAGTVCWLGTVITGVPQPSALESNGGYWDSEVRRESYGLTVRGTVRGEIARADTLRAQADLKNSDPTTKRKWIKCGVRKTLQCQITVICSLRNVRLHIRALSISP